MKKPLVVVIALVTALIGFVGGYVFYSETIARYNTVTAVCVAMNQAVNQGLLQPHQVQQLGFFTGKELKQNYSSVASKLTIQNDNADRASAGSMCSQFLVGIKAGQ